MNRTMDREKTKILIAAGGTGGHVFPGVAIAEALVKIMPQVQVIFAGTSNGPEAQLVPEEGWPLIFVGSSSVHSGGAWNRTVVFLKAVLATFTCFGVLRKMKPRTVLGVGGFAAGPLLFAAAMMRIPTAIIEPNAVAGRTNRLLGRFVKKIFLGFNAAAKSFPASKTRVTGNPVRESVTKVSRGVYDGSGPFTILCYGGSQGAKHLNEVMMDSMQRLKGYAERIRVIHQVGKASSVEEVAYQYKKDGFEAEVFMFSPRMADFYSEADVAIARSGAGTVAELAAVKLPAVLVPYPYAVDDHQRANAQELVRAGGAVLIDDSDLKGADLAETLKEFMEHPEKLQSMSQALNEVGKPHAANKIAEECAGMFIGKKEHEHVQ